MSVLWGKSQRDRNQREDVQGSREGRQLDGKQGPHHISVEKWTLHAVR